ncbi:unnamed protein product [Cylindrotheca closterium]|uniref:DUF6824 domain-containing protein n=1 Tax=Cylindrotheca closterium TaxID=2856 RepID=A0AAD2JPF6_9STRA|nr:unnamed protein product [Cylindrotheca closterium]
MPRKNSDHTSKLEMKQTEDLLASEMNRLSMQERANAFADVHCVGEDIQETPEMVQRSLEEFENTVQKERNPVYEMAVNQNRAYVEDPKFRLKFLRAKLYDARKSVRQMMSFLEQKAKYFGNDKVAREIDLSDLSKEDMELMLSGLYHIQEGRDRMGRVIVHFFGKNLSTCKADDLIRALYYIWWAIIIPLPEVQRKGVAAIYNDTARENHGMPDFNFFKETLLFFTSLPVRFSVTHYCRHAELGRTLTLNDPLLSFVLDRLPTYFRTRTRIHHRSSMELQYQLQSHGIPTDTLPLDVDGNIREDILNLWFDKHVKESNQNNLFHQAKVVQTAPEAMEADNSLLNHAPVDANEDEARNALMKLRKAPGDQIRGSDGNSESDDLATAVIKPTDNDLLFGKGYRLQMHPGNIRVREQVLRTRDEYENTPRMKRREISMRLAQMFRSNGVRFLKKAESGEWIESSIVEADKKIGQIFREFRKKEQRGRPNASRA